MKKVAVIVVLAISFACTKTEKLTVELSCGQCQLGLTSIDGCDLAVRIDGKAYVVDGATIDDFGDAHDETTGFCEVIRTADITGEVVDERFKVGTIELKD